MAYDSTLVVYTGIPLPYITVTPGMNLQTILQNINTAVNTLNPVPDYSTFTYGPYHGYTLTDPNGNVITTITGFVEGTANGIGQVSSDLSTFIGTTYAGDQSTISSAITALQVPGVTYVPFSITNTDNQATVFSKIFTGLNTFGINTLTSTLDPYGANWSTLSISPSHSLLTTWNSVIAYLSSLSTAVSGKQATLPTFNNSGNCLKGGTTDTVPQTIDYLITYVCSLPTFDPSSIVNGSCLAAQNSLQDWIQHIVDILNSGIKYNVVADSTSLLDGGVNGCGGRTFSVNPNWSGLGVVKATGSDTADTLNQKLTAGSNVSIAAVNGNTQLEISVDLGTQNQVAINSSDTKPDYLAAKLASGSNSWGLSMAMGVSSDNQRLEITPTITDPSAFIQNTLSYISSNPDLLAQFCALTVQCNGCTCAAATNLAITLTSYSGCEFGLTWTPAVSGTVSQLVKYRLQGDTAWVSGVNITAANPQTTSASSAAVSPGCTNTIIEFQIESVCGTGSNNTLVMHGICYAQQTVSSNVTSGVISLTQPAMPTVDTVEYVLYSGNTPLQTVLGTGSNPTISFTSVSAGTYTVKYRYRTSIDGTIVSSNDSSQHNAYYVTGNITVS